MKIKTVLTTLSTITALAGGAFSQNNGSTINAPNAAGSFSTFSMPQNMGAMVNSADDAQLSVIASNGLSFYFASTRNSDGTFNAPMINNELNSLELTIHDAAIRHEQ